MTENKDKNGSPWESWSRHVLLTLERFDEDIKELNKNLTSTKEELSRNVVNTKEELNKAIAEVRTEIAMLKIKSGLWGAAGAMIPTLGAILFFLLTRMPK